MRVRLSRPIALACICVVSSCGILSPSRVLAETPASPIEGFADTNGVRLQYLDWEGTGPALILIHGLADNPHVFDDLAPAFTDRFHVVAYARRASGSSEVKGPYDIGTLTEDLRGLLDALRIRKASLVGYSAGGDEITNFAADHPDRVDRIIYLDAAYDFADADFRAAVNNLPVGPFERPASAMSSLNAYRSYEQATSYPEFSDSDMQRVQANIYAKVVIQPDGTLHERTPKSVIDALYAAQSKNKRRQYARVRCPALAIYSENLYDLNVSDPQQRAQIVSFEDKYWKPYQVKSVERVRRELAHVEIVRSGGAHGNFTLTHREQVVNTMRRFLGEPSEITAQE